MNKKLDFKKISSFDAPKLSPGFLLWKVSLTWRRQIESALLEHELTHPQFVVLASLGWLTRDGTSVSQKEVALMAGLDVNTNSQIHKGLEKKGLITRQPTSDARVKSPALTSKGQAVLKKALPAVEEEDFSFFSSLTKSEKKELLSLFNQLL